MNFSDLPYEQRREMLLNREISADDFDRLISTFTQDEVRILMDGLADRWGDNLK